MKYLGHELGQQKDIRYRLRAISAYIKKRNMSKKLAALYGAEFVSNPELTDFVREVVQEAKAAVW